MSRALLNRRREMMQAAGGGLPSEYQQVEFIQSTGTQRITLDVPVKSTDVIKAKFRYVVISPAGQGYKYVFLGNDTQTVYRSIRFFFMWFWYASYSGNNFIFGSQNNSSVTLNNGANTNIVEFELALDYAIYNGTRYSLTPGETTSSQNYKLFIGGYIEMYAFEIEGRCKLVPCYRKADNVAGLYDIVNNKFYPNEAGGDDFIIGPNV